jgi:probable phosphoglycerate mutase
MANEHDGTVSTMTSSTEADARFFVIRHGSTAWSVSGRHTGLTDLSLSETGEAESRLLAPLLRKVSFSQVWVSPLLRAQQTCELAGLKPQARIEPDLVEWDYGDYEGLRSAEIQQRRPGWIIFRDGCPNGEMPQQVSDRADRIIGRLQEMTNPVALFSHGHFGAVLAARWIGLPILEAQHLPLATASISVLGYDAHHPETTVIQQWNSVPQPG